ncbi:hypothetical protein MSG28_014877 [Choristoneura fumiferana]|uniref:Uncharacterized protein n=1 Tax=Choristoneura fumiferana TaxID=7141 RepID=A0ACC0KXK1_CHOFU|nr:hypothetical protein MSG28_014877 [Choristoneura fumiferana]
MGERVRNLKASTKDKTVWTPEVNKLLELKKQLAAAQAQPQAPPTSGDSVASLEKAIAEQEQRDSGGCYNTRTTRHRNPTKLTPAHNYPRFHPYFCCNCQICNKAY